MKVLIKDKEHGCLTLYSIINKVAFSCICIYASGPQWLKCNESCPLFNFNEKNKTLKLCNGVLIEDMEIVEESKEK